MRALSKQTKKITISTLTTSVNDLGGLDDTWDTGILVWAERDNVKGGSGIEAEQEVADADVKFTIRYSTTVAGYNPMQQRVTVGSETFDIVAIVPEPANRPQVMHLYGKRAL